LQGSDIIENIPDFISDRIIKKRKKPSTVSNPLNVPQRVPEGMNLVNDIRTWFSNLNFGTFNFQYYCNNSLVN